MERQHIYVSDIAYPQQGHIGLPLVGPNLEARIHVRDPVNH